MKPFKSLGFASSLSALITRGLAIAAVLAVTMVGLVGAAYAMPVVEKANVLSLEAEHPSIWLDYDSDDNRDFLVLWKNEGQRSDNQVLLFHHKANGSFRDVTGDAGLGNITGMTGIDAGDVDGDGYPDFIVVE